MAKGRDRSASLFLSIHSYTFMYEYTHISEFAERERERARGGENAATRRETVDTQTTNSYGRSIVCHICSFVLYECSLHGGSEIIRVLWNWLWKLPGKVTCVILPNILWQNQLLNWSSQQDALKTLPTSFAVVLEAFWCGLEALYERYDGVMEVSCHHLGAFGTSEEVFEGTFQFLFLSLEGTFERISHLS